MQYNQPYGISDPEAIYVNGNPSTGTMGSIPPASSVEYDQREIVAVIKYAFDRGLIDFNGIPCASPSNSDLTQLLKAIFGMTNLHKLQADVTIYINASTGDDLLGDGTVAKPYRTYQTAVNKAQAVMDLNLKHRVIFHGTGNFTQGCYLGGLFAGQAGVGSVVFDNANATFTITNGDCFDIFGGQCQIIGGSYQASADGIHSNQGCGIQVGGSAVVDIQGVNFLACGTAHFWIYGIVQVGKGYSIAGNSPNHIVVQPQAVYTQYSSTDAQAALERITLVGTPNFSSQFCSCYGGSAGFGFGFTGAATGKKFNISGFGTIFTMYRGVNILPGNIAGTIAPSTGNGEYT